MSLSQCSHRIICRETLNRGNEMILNSLKLVAETEEFATNEIMPELQRNRETLESAREKVIYPSFSNGALFLIQLIPTDFSIPRSGGHSEENIGFDDAQTQDVGIFLILCD